MQERLNQLTNALSEDSQPERRSDEAIAIFIPKRNIETWIHFLQGEVVNDWNFIAIFIGYKVDLT